MELMTVGSISDMIDTCGMFTENQVACVAHAVLHGLAYLHSQKKLHRDIKAGNVLMDLSGAIKLGMSFSPLFLLFRLVCAIVTSVG
jgi:serine/threonine protein kinase